MSMNQKQFAILIVVAMVTGLAGGSTSSWLLMGKPAFAQKTTPQVKVIRAEKFELVDKGGHEHGSLEIGPDGNPAFVLYDVDHHSRVVLDLMANGNARLFLSDQEGKIRSVLGLQIDGSPFLHLKDENRQIIWAVP
jgi:hypothetical protein